MARKIKAIINCTPQQTDKVILLGEEVKAGISTSVFYTSPNPTMLVLDGAISAATTLHTKKGTRKLHGTTEDKIGFKNAIITLFNLLTQLCAFVNNTTPGDASALATSNFPLSGMPHKLPLMEPPRNVRRMLQSNLGLHQAKIKCTKPANAAKHQKVTYLYYRSFTLDFASAKVVATKTRASYIDTPAMPGDAPGKVYYWVTAFTSAGESEPSDVCVVSIMPL